MTSGVRSPTWSWASRAIRRAASSTSVSTLTVYPVRPVNTDEAITSRTAPVRRASSTDQRRAHPAPEEPSTPTTMRWDEVSGPERADAPGERTTATEHAAWVRQCWPTEPSRRPRKPPSPRDPDHEEIGVTTGIDQHGCGRALADDVPDRHTGHVLRRPGVSLLDAAVGLVGRCRN